ncbi:MAG: hypothetical protein ACI4KA_02260 [Oscillospiraceae bacterium]
MGFLDELVSTTKNVAATAGKKTDEAVKLSKLKIKKSQIKSDIKAKYEKLGELVYNMNKANEKDEEAYNAAIADIDDLNAKLADLDRQLDELNGEVACEKCGAKTKNDNSYCPKCGTKLPEIVAEEPEKAEEAKEAAAELVEEKKDEE